MAAVSESIFRATSLSIVATASFASSSIPPNTEPLLQQANLVYQGAFRVLGGNSDRTSFDYGGTALAYNPVKNSLFITGHDWYQLSAEISIPSVVKSTDVDELATATLIQPLTDALGGRLNAINPKDPNSKKIGGHLVYDGKLIVSAYSYYDGAGTQVASHFSRPLDLSTTGIVGPIRVGSQYPGFVSGYMALIPPEWQALLGGPALTGNCCLSIISEQSSGPAVSVFDPSQLGTATKVPAKALVGYPYPYVLGPGQTTQNKYFTLATKVAGVVFPIGTRSVLFFGRQGTGPYCYGIGTGTMPVPSGQCYDPADSSKGTHAFPYVYQVWAYDANDLLAVKRGLSLQYEVRPYAIWTLALPFGATNSGHLLGGAAYDPQTNRIFVSQLCVNRDCAAVIDVFKVDPRALSSPPSNVNVRQDRGPKRQAALNRGLPSWAYKYR